MHTIDNLFLGAKAQYVVLVTRCPFPLCFFASSAQAPCGHEQNLSTILKTDVATLSRSEEQSPNRSVSSRSCGLATERVDVFNT